eukprot:scaffold26156_cov80-Cyclotella_meneghiniana.AAC.3
MDHTSLETVRDCYESSMWMSGEAFGKEGPLDKSDRIKYGKGMTKLGQTRPPSVSSIDAARDFEVRREVRKRIIPDHTGQTGRRANCSILVTRRDDFGVMIPERLFADAA